MLSASLVVVWTVSFSPWAGTLICCATVCYAMVHFVVAALLLLFYVLCYSVLSISSLWFACSFASSDCVCCAFACLGFAVRCLSLLCFLV